MQHWILLVLQVLICVLLAWKILHEIQEGIENYEGKQKEIGRGSCVTSTDSKNHNGES